MSTHVQAKIRGQGQYYSDGREILFVDAKKSDCAAIGASDGVRKPIRLRIGREVYQAGIRTTVRMHTVWICSNLLGDRGDKVSLAQALVDGGFSKNQSVVLEVQKLKLADELWQAGVSDSMPVTTEQKKLLDSRWAAYRAGKLRRISLAELDRRLTRK